MNLVVLTAMKERELAVGVVNLVLGNLCLSNLASAALVKAISIVHHGYAVAKNTTKPSIAFCALHVVGYRATWAILPLAIVTISWVILASHLAPTASSAYPSLSSSRTTRPASPL